jgi:hypothetical protein
MCQALPATPSSAHASRGPALVLLTLDGARAEDVLGRPDLLPNVAALRERGVTLGDATAPMFASGPRFVSLPGYREILTGRNGAHCVDNRCPPIDEPTLLDELRVHEQLSIDDLVTVASWETIERAVSVAKGSLVISSGRRGGATRARLAVNANAARDLRAGERASAGPGHGDSRPDGFRAALALDILDTRQPRFFYVALGDSDEFAHRGDHARYLGALAAADQFLGRLLARIDRANTVVILTADHGRSANFVDHGDSAESSAVWLVAAGGPITHRRATAPHHLCDIAPTLRALLGLPEDASPRAGEPIAELLPGAAQFTALATR